MRTSLLKRMFFLLSLCTISFSSVFGQAIGDYCSIVAADPTSIAVVTPIITSGAVTAFTVNTAGAGYTAAVVTVTGSISGSATFSTTITTGGVATVVPGNILNGDNRNFSGDITATVLPAVLSNTAGSWKVCVTPSTWDGATTASSVPSATTNVWVLPNTIVQINAALSCLNLHVGGTLIGLGSKPTINGVTNVDAGGVFVGNTDITLKGNVVVDGQLRGMTNGSGVQSSLVLSGPDGSTVTVNGGGILGGASIGSSGESLFISSAQTGTVTITGTGIVNIHHFETAYTNTATQTTIFDIDANLNNTDATKFTCSLQCGNNGNPGGTKTLTVNAGKTLTITQANGTFGAPTITSYYGNGGGIMNYNINGTVDVGNGKFILTTNDKTSGNVVSVNIGASGKLILGSTVSFFTYRDAAQPAPKIVTAAATESTPGSIIEFKGSSPTTITLGRNKTTCIMPTFPSTIPNLIVNNSNGVTLPATTTVDNSIALTSGTLSTSAYSLILKGSTTGTGQINTSTTGTLNFAGTTEQKLSSENLTSGGVNNLVVSAGSKLTTSGTITATNLTINSSEVNGTGTLIDNGTLSATSANVLQFLTGADANVDGIPDGPFRYLTSPVVGATSSAFTPSATANRLWSYNEAGGATSAEVYTPITVGSEVLNSGKGYVTRLTGNTTVNFTGTALVNGSPTIDLTYTPTSGKPGFNLIGNPYPSYLNIRSAFKDVTEMEKGIWYRSYAGGIMGFDTYNLTDSTQVKHDGGTTVLSSLVPPMQAFWVKTTAPKTITLSNAMRAHQVSGNLLRSSNADLQKIRLNVSNGIHSDETLIGFYSDASDAFDNHDSRKMFNGVTNLPEIYTLAGTTEVAINGLSPLNDVREVKLGFKTLQDGTFSIKASEILNMEAGQTVVLKDNLLTVAQDLMALPEYSFTSTATTTTDRFSVMIGKVATAVETSKSPVFDVQITENNTMEVSLSGVIGNMTRIMVYNAMGQELTSVTAHSEKVNLSNRFAAGVYLVKVVAPGFQASRKTIIR